MKTEYRDFCEEKECINYAFMKASKNRPCIGLAVALPNILKDCEENCPYSKLEFYTWKVEGLIKKVGLKI